MIDMLTSSLIAITIAPFFVLAWFLMFKAEAVADNLLGTAKSRVWTPVVFSFSWATLFFLSSVSLK